jgi:hypothetical protein
MKSVIILFQAISAYGKNMRKGTDRKLMVIKLVLAKQVQRNIQKNC